MSSRSRISIASSPVPAETVRVPLLADEHGQDVLEDLLVVDDQDVHAEVAAREAVVPRQLHDEAGALAGLALGPQRTAVAAHDLRADRQARARCRRG